MMYMYSTNYDTHYMYVEHDIVCKKNYQKCVFFKFPNENISTTKKFKLQCVYQ